MLTERVITLSAGTKNVAESLKNDLENFRLQFSATPDSEEYGFEVTIGDLKRTLKQFEILLLAEFDGMPLYKVDAVLCYNTQSLIESGDLMIPSDFRGLLPNLARDDIRAGARCLAFELPTSASFHLARATEATMRFFHEELYGPLPKQGERTMGKLPNSWIKPEHSALKANIQHIAATYRNPISHPDEVVTKPNAHKQVGIYVATIIELLDGVDRHKNAPHIP
ncbi:MAG: hypothetical protein ABL962_01445 [Fimbriimonadaceae bacterium]